MPPPVNNQAEILPAVFGVLTKDLANLCLEHFAAEWEVFGGWLDQQGIAKPFFEGGPEATLNNLKVFLAGCPESVGLYTNHCGDAERRAAVAMEDLDPALKSFRGDDRALDASCPDRPKRIGEIGLGNEGQKKSC